MKIAFVRELSEEEVEQFPKWSSTTDKILEVVKSKGSVSNKELQQLTSYKLNTINAQVSILRKYGVVKNLDGVEKKTT